MAPTRTRTTVRALALLSLITLTTAHGSGTNSNPGPQAILKADGSPETDWATIHMVSEHHISTFEPSAFFALHDFDGDGTWEGAEIRRTYGLAPDSTDGIGGPGAKECTEERKAALVTEVLRLFDADRDGVISRDEFMKGTEAGRRLPDWGLGPGHHGDDEYEYEIHHFERFHNENTEEEDLIHPEDIAHFAKHDKEEMEADRQALQDRMRIVEKNIPKKFRR